MAVIFQSVLALLLIFTADVERIVNRTEFLLQMVLLLTVWGVIHLRIRQPDLPRPCRAWGYPCTTILFLVMIAFTLSFLLRERPDATRWGLGILVTGIAFYLLARPGKSAADG
jgi:APA family basic amino acid/polyamine antiporter